VVQTHLLDSVDRAALLAKIQQQNMERMRAKHGRWGATKGTNAKADTVQNPVASPLWKERRVRDYKKANDLCFYCGGKFVPGHLLKCTKKAKPQLNVLVVHDLDLELTEETLNELAMEDVLIEEMG
jgi:hypothetical protein